jgi:hypothetical protein
MEETSAGYLAEHAGRITGQAGGELGPDFPLELASRLEVIGTIKYPSDHVPLC